MTPASSNVAAAIEIFPLQLMTRLDGRSPLTSISEWTGVSRSALRKAHRTTPRPTTLERAKRYGESRAAQALRHAGFDTDAIAAYIQSAPSNQVGDLRPYQDLVHYLVPPTSAPLSLTMETARRLDELSAELRASRERDTLGPWISAMSSFIAREPMYCEQSFAPLPDHPLDAIERASVSIPRDGDRAFRANVTGDSGAR